MSKLEVPHASTLFCTVPDCKHPDADDIDSDSESRANHIKTTRIQNPHKTLESTRSGSLTSRVIPNSSLKPKQCRGENFFCASAPRSLLSEVELTEREAAHLAGNSFVMSTMGSFVLYVLAHCELMTEQPVFHVRSDNGVKSRSSFGSLATPSPKKYSLHGLSP